MRKCVPSTETLPMIVALRRPVVSLWALYVRPAKAGAQTSTSPFCDAIGMTNAGCTTTTFVDTHFAPSAYAVSTFFFHYAAGDQGLLYHEWKNASDDRGGNGGDIATG